MSTPGPAPKAETKAKRHYYEASYQIATVAWARKHAQEHPALAWLYHCPNGGYRSREESARLQKMGVTPGIADLALPARSADGMWAGLYVEMKSGRNKLTPEQERFFAYCEGAGYKTATCYSAADAIGTICDYLGIEEETNEQKDDGNNG